MQTYITINQQKSCNSCRYLYVYCFFYFFIQFSLISHNITLNYNIDSLIIDNTCTDKYLTNYKFKIQITNTTTEKTT